MKTAFIFPGQGAQFVGMGLPLYEGSEKMRLLFEKANEILGFKISDVMFRGTADDLKETKVTQPAVFLHSVAAAMAHDKEKPRMLAGHSLGEFSALVVAGALSFEDGLRLVAARAFAMQKACEKKPSTMAAILGIEDQKVIEICKTITEGVVVPANFNSPGQLVISGDTEAVIAACEKLKAAGAKRALPLKVGGAFHSPLMESAREELASAIQATSFTSPQCPIYQNVVAAPVVDPQQIKENLVKQLTAPVRWVESVKAMVRDGADKFLEFGPGNVLQGLVKKIDPSVEVESFDQ